MKNKLNNAKNTLKELTKKTLMIIGALTVIGGIGFAAYTAIYNAGIREGELRSEEYLMREQDEKDLKEFREQAKKQAEVQKQAEQSK